MEAKLKKYVIKTILPIFLIINSFVAYSSDIDNCDKPFNKINFELIETVDNVSYYETGFRLSSNLDTDDTVLVVPPLEAAVKIYLNGSLLVKRGNISSNYTNRIHTTSSTLIPETLLDKDGINRLRIEQFRMHGERSGLPSFYIATKSAGDRYTFYRNLFGPKILTGIGFLCLIISIYFFIVFFNKSRKYRYYYLYFALFAVCYFIAYTNNIFSYDYMPSRIVEVVSRIALIILSFWSMPIFLEYSNYFKHKNIIIFTTGSLFFISLVLMVIQPDITNMFKVYFLTAVPLVFIKEFLMLILTGIYFLKKRNLGSSLFFLCFIISCIAITHDSYNVMILGHKPFLLLIPYCILFFIITAFIIIAIEQSDLIKFANTQSDELKKLNDGLEDTIKLRTDKLTNVTEQLKVELEKKNRLYSIIAHDLRNPILGIKKVSSILYKNYMNSNEDTAGLNFKYINLVKKEADLCYELLDNLLSWTRIQLGTNLKHIRSFDIKKSVDDVIKSYNFFAASKEITLVNLITKPIVITADAEFITIVNALKFTRRGGRIEVYSSFKDDTIEISVKDNGIGIKPELIEELFKLDKKVYSLGTEDEDGYGLGLILCKEIMKLNNGDIKVESRLEQGSIFTIAINSSDKESE